MVWAIFLITVAEYVRKAVSRGNALLWLMVLWNIMHYSGEHKIQPIVMKLRRK